MALYIRHSIFHLALLLYVRPETFGPYYDVVTLPRFKRLLKNKPETFLSYESCAQFKLLYCTEIPH